MDNKLKIISIIKDFEEKTGARVVYLTLSGSKLYGTDNVNSDSDFKGIFVPSVKSILLKKDLDHYVKNTNNSKIKNSAEDIDLTIHSFYTFFNLLSKSETGMADMLFSMWREDTIIYQDKEFVSFIRRNYKSFLNKNMKSFIGYTLSQTKKFGIKGARYSELTNFIDCVDEISEDKYDLKLAEFFNYFENCIDEYKFKYINFTMAPGPKGNKTQELEKYISVLGKLFHGNITLRYFIERVTQLFDQFGNRTKAVASTISKTDFKAASHAYRVASEVKELLETGFIQFPLQEAKYIKRIKEGKENFNNVVDQIEKILNNVDDLLESTNLPKEVNKDKIEELTLEVIDKFSK